MCRAIHAVLHRSLRGWAPRTPWAPNIRARSQTSAGTWCAACGMGSSRCSCRVVGDRIGPSGTENVVEKLQSAAAGEQARPPGSSGVLALPVAVFVGEVQQADLLELGRGVQRGAL